MRGYEFVWVLIEDFEFVSCLWDFFEDFIFLFIKFYWNYVDGFIENMYICVNVSLFYGCVIGYINFCMMWVFCF